MSGTPACSGRGTRCCTTSAPRTIETGMRRSGACGDRGFVPRGWLAFSGAALERHQCFIVVAITASMFHRCRCSGGGPAGRCGGRGGRGRCDGGGGQDGPGCGKGTGLRAGGRVAAGGAERGWSGGGAVRSGWQRLRTAPGRNPGARRPGDSGSAGTDPSPSISVTGPSGHRPSCRVPEVPSRSPGRTRLPVSPPTGGSNGCGRSCSSLGPHSTRPTEPAGSSASRAATMQPAVPPPTTR